MGNMRSMGKVEANMVQRLQRLKVGDRSRVELLVLAQAVDLLEETQGTKRVRELLVRRMCGILLAEDSGDWTLAEVLTPHVRSQILPPHLLHGIARDAKRHASIFNREKKSDLEEVNRLKKRLKGMSAELAAMHRKHHLDHQPKKVGGH